MFSKNRAPPLQTSHKSVGQLYIIFAPLFFAKCWFQNSGARTLELRQSTRLSLPVPLQQLSGLLAYHQL